MVTMAPDGIDWYKETKSEEPIMLTPPFGAFDCH